MDESTVTLSGDGIEVEVSLTEFSRAIGEQYILDGEDSEDIAYLGGIALECYDDPSYDLVDILMEFLRNNGTTAATLEECDEIEQMLR